MRNRRQLNFRELLDYKRANLLGNEGLYLPIVVTLEQLPENIFFYYLQKDRHDVFHSFSKNAKARRTAGIFFTKTAFDFDKEFQYIKKNDDFQLHEKLQTPEEFYDFFQVKLSLDKQISYADEKRFADTEENDEEESENHFFRGKQGQYG